MPDHDCVYVTSGWGIHDERWVAGLRSTGWSPAIIALGRDVPNDAGLRMAVIEKAGSDLPVLAGPLDSVTGMLADLPLRLVGLSWGFDVHNLSQAGADLTWLAGLGGLIVDSTETARIAEEAGLPPERITYLPWGVDITNFSPDGPVIDPADFDIAEGSRIVLSLRALEPMYRVSDIIDAFAQLELPDGVLVIGHSGSLREDLNARVQQLGLAARVRFIGTTPEADLPALLRAADCYVTASEVDGTSVTLLQAMACGLPVVASATAGNLQWVTNDITGWTFPTGDVHALAECLRTALTADSAPVVARARALVEREADWNANLPRLQAAMDRVVLS